MTLKFRTLIVSEGIPGRGEVLLAPTDGGAHFATLVINDAHVADILARGAEVEISISRLPDVAPAPAITSISRSFLETLLQEHADLERRIKVLMPMG